ncbi:uncharacterized protein LAESUDRAFT_727858 [Laetiporus sulphureus 93-53]|uniref:Uncharacterized protein n=1 Tax=Laetiporus sulphureus 93-53 TaxID=1314785 RepID=A0A165DE45_9APHY|nr:uncharacterized protein LAESUDRAFT_727858 [Laetiporus sulphureus 93-53]KZT04681.1 hypothetical protein LAESUDRAFT_727858 [Laetiporus sulphureus 93-53]
MQPYKYSRIVGTPESANETGEDDPDEDDARYQKRGARVKIEVDEWVKKSDNTQDENDHRWKREQGQAWKRKASWMRD